ncbi:condensation domain-containing protein [Bacillus cereus group sp. FL70]|uniref:condensation domain-containing protein n=1 Tax=Bacillus cereus group sp. FL70 TaxID=3040254 RepID=UPI00339A40F6
MRNDKRVYYNLTHPQKRIWYTHKININSPLHNIGGCLKINEAIDVEFMKKTLNFIIKNNEGLRLRFSEKGDQPVQYVQEFVNENIDFLDFSNDENPKKEFESWSKALFKKNFILEDRQLYYFAIYKISEKEYGVLLNIHHIISDGWSITLIQKQICEIYKRLKNKEEIYIDEYYSYLDFIKEEEEYLNSDRFIRNKEFWKKNFRFCLKIFYIKHLTV